MAGKAGTDDLGALMRQWRGGLTLDELADLSGVSASMLDHVEKGRRNHSAEALARIGQALRKSRLDKLTAERARLERQWEQAQRAADQIRDRIVALGEAPTPARRGGPRSPLDG